MINHLTFYFTSYFLFLCYPMKRCDSVNSKTVQVEHSKLSHVAKEVSPRDFYHILHSLLRHENSLTSTLPLLLLASYSKFCNTHDSGYLQLHFFFIRIVFSFTTPFKSSQNSAVLCRPFLYQLMCSFASYFVGFNHQKIQYCL